MTPGLGVMVLLCRKEFVETKEVRLEDYVNYISTWSALKKYRDANEDDPLPKLHSR